MKTFNLGKFILGNFAITRDEINDHISKLHALEAK